MACSFTWIVPFPSLFGVLSFFALTSWLLMTPRLQTHAVLALALGLVWQLKRLATLRRQLFLSIVKRTARWAAAVWLLISIASLMWDAIAERGALAHPPSSPSPNVLLIVLDTVRAQSLSVYGYERPTSPNLERLARRGVLFERAVSTAPWTITSHASIFTGRYPHELSADWDSPLDGRYPTLAEYLRARGYATAGFVGNTVACNAGSGLSRGFAHYEDFTVTPAEFIISSSLCREIIHIAGTAALRSQCRSALPTQIPAR